MTIHEYMIELAQTVALALILALLLVKGKK